MDKSIVGMHGL